MTNVIDEGFKKAVEDDEALRQSIRRLAWVTVREAFDMLAYGRPQDKITLITRLVSPMLKALGEDGDSERETAALRAELEEVLAEVRGETRTPAESSVDPRQELSHGTAEPELGSETFPPDLPGDGGPA